jgi:hypothetical protein
MKTKGRQRMVMAAVLAAVLCGGTSQAIDGMQGVMRVVPAPKDKPVKIDGDLSDWDLSAREWMIVDELVANRYAADVALMYGQDCLYIGVEALMGTPQLLNPEPPDGKIWCGHSVEFRCIAHPDAPYPFQADGRRRDMNSPLAKFYPFSNTIRMYRNTVTGTNHVIIQPGPPYGPGQTVDPAGTELAVQPSPDNGRYALEARIPWKAIGVEDGKNPFQAGQKTAAFWTVTWPGNYRIEGLCASNPSGQGYARMGDWGRIEFVAGNRLPARHETLAEYLAKADRQEGNEIEFELPEALKVSVSVFGKNGELLREVAGGLPRPAGKSKVYWDGFDWRGNHMPEGKYPWKAYASPGLSPQFIGCVGTGGTPGYQTPDGTGGWGGEYGGPIDVAADQSGVYLLWLSYESGKALVKLGHDGRTLWRSGPLADALTACATNGRYLYVTFFRHGGNQRRMIRLDTATGAEIPFPGTARIALGEPTHDPENTDSESFTPELSGLAASTGEVFLSLYRSNKILVLDAESGVNKRELDLANPRGLCLDKSGDLLAISCKFHTHGNSVFRFAKGDGKAAPILPLYGMKAPYDLTFDEAGRMYVTDCGATNQIWVYANVPGVGWAHKDWIGKPGGRPWAGRYDSGALLRPTGVCADGRGGLYVTEVEIPRVVKKYRTADLGLEKEWFGDLAYGPGACSDPEDPRVVYAQFQTGSRFCLVRGRLKGDGSNAAIEAYWDLSKLNLPWPSSHGAHGAPIVAKGKNGVTYLSFPFVNYETSCVPFYTIDGDRITPVAYVGGWQTLWFGPGKTSHDRPRYVEFWSDLNHNGSVEEDERRVRPQLAGESLATAQGRFTGIGTVFLSPQGDLYLFLANNKTIRVPADKMDSFGAIHWNPAKAQVVARDVHGPGEAWQNCGGRGTVVGFRADKEGNTYYGLNFYKNPRSSLYASAAWTEAMGEGLGHCGEFEAVRIAKFAPDGRRLWEVGRKATKVARPGETYHFWEFAGVVGKGYAAVATEATPIVFYSPDGFFVDMVLGDPCRNDPFSPTNIGGGETFSGRAVWYPDRGECYIFSGNAHAYAYRLDGFARDGTVKRERRFSGEVALVKHVNPYPSLRIKPEPYPLARVAEDPMKTNKWPGHWETVVGNDGNGLARVQVVQDGTTLFARFEVTDTTPLENKTPDLYQVFKWGDAVGLCFGKAGTRAQPAEGDIRILAALVNGKPAVVAMVPKGGKVQRPYEYFTPASGRKEFAFVGEIEGAEAKLDKTPTGYTGQLRIPIDALAGLSFSAGGHLAFEAEVLCSGAGTRGLQTISRNHLYTSKGFSPAKMTEDIPSEAWLYPDQWGEAAMK